MQPLNKLLISLNLFISHFEISGTDFNDVQPLNNHDKLEMLFIFHFVISGIDSKDWQSINKPSIF